VRAVAAVATAELGREKPRLIISASRWLALR
jgi:hypothetical protein